MARPKEFDRKQALDQAMELFWTRGYEATTMTDLRHAMGVGRQSLYDTFGDKDKLFREALDQYASLSNADVGQFLTEEDGLDGIRSFFRKRVSALASGTRRGCLIMNSCMELSPHDEVVALRVRKCLRVLEKGFETALKGAQKKGKIATGSDVGKLSIFLTSQLAGMVVMAKNRASRQHLQAIADTALQSIG
ncbi:MAG: TetR/AcrR family transcriptional regulator [Planctomycetota bacterium]